MGTIRIMFDGFALDHIDVGEATLRVRHGGSGPPLVLLHGHPRTHMTWYAVADTLAGVTVDRAPDDADAAAGRRIACPALFCWSTRDDMAELYGDPLAIWRRWADDLVGVPIKSGHHMAEENPAALADALAELLRR
jgi:pimeloyl-ACP methyl ester carboxylesterase